jgi:hypothetical protein
MDENTEEEQTVVKQYDKPIPSNSKKLQSHLDGITKVVGIQHRLSESFVSLFLNNFWDFPLSSSEALSISNWTHHVYYCIRATAKNLSLGCTFETMGRFDAIIDNINYPGVILVAEWESNANSVFGKDSELDKLWKGANQHENADAFLLTYCPIESLMEFTKKVVRFWQSQKSKRKFPPNLFLVIVVTKRNGNSNDFVFIRTQEIKNSALYLWHDLGLVTTNEYLDLVSTL